MTATVSHLATARRASFQPMRLTEARQILGWSMTELAQRANLTRQAISRFEAGTLTPGAECLATLAELLRQPLSFFSIRREARQQIDGPAFYRSFRSATARSRAACQVGRQWLVDITAALERLVNFPTARFEDFRRNAYADDDIELIATRCRAAWGLRDGPIGDLVGLLESNGAIATRADLGSRKIDAFSFFHDDRPFIVLGSDKRSAVRSRFDAAHELGHLVMHRRVTEDQLARPDDLARIEREADRFAGAFLMPASSFPREIYATRLKFFLQLKKRWRVSVAAMVTRCSQLGLTSDDQTLNLRKQMSAQGMRTHEPLDDELPFEQPGVLGKAVSLVASMNKSLLTEMATEIGLATRTIEVICNVSPGTIGGSEDLAPVLSLKAALT